MLVSALFKLNFQNNHNWMLPYVTPPFMLDDVKSMVQLVRPQYPHTVGPVILPAMICLAMWHLIFFVTFLFYRGLNKV